MPDEALQTAFEIKTTCDEISRKLLRWHWENKPGEHSLGALLDHIRTRQQESPEYYDRLPDLAGRNSWQQLDTTLCMRVLLDPEKDAVHQLDLLGNTEHPAAARRACNAVRTARNEAAHASDRTAAAQAAILFNEAVEALEEGYAGAPLRTSELGQYYRLAEDYLSRCGAKKPIASAAPEEKAPRAAKSGQSTAGRKKEGTSGSASRHSVEVRITGGSSRLGGTPLQPHLSAYFIGRRTVLSGGRYFRRVGHGWQLLPGRTRFPYRSAGNGDAGSRRVCVDKI